MNRDEINRRISELYDLYPCKFSGCDHSECNNGIYDWHTDRYWPTLLREIPKVSLFGYRTKPRWSLDAMGHDVTGDDLGELVCLAWLRWKEHGR